MGLFGNKDVKLLERELVALSLALRLGPGASSSPERFAAGVQSAKIDAVQYAVRAKAAGQQGPARAAVARISTRGLSEQAKAYFDDVIISVEAALS